MAFWTQVSGEGDHGAGGGMPPGGCCLSVVCDVAQDRLLLFGGGLLNHYVNDTYSFCLKRREWAKLAARDQSLLPALMSHTAVIHNDAMIVYGGQDVHGNTSRTFSLCLKTLVWTVLPTVNDPPARKGHAAFMHDGKMWVLFGSGDRGTLSDVVTLDLEAKPPVWSSVVCSGAAAETAVPSGRMGHSVVVHDGCVYMFGGVNSSVSSSLIVREEWLCDTWRLDLATRQWTPLVNMSHRGPKGRYSHVSWMLGREVFIFGGDSTGCSVYFNDLWAFDVDTHRWRLVDAPGDVPSPRSGCAAVTHGGAVMLFGGELPAEASEEPSYSDSMFVLHHHKGRGPLFDAVARHVVEWDLDLSEDTFTHLCAARGLPECVVAKLLAIKPVSTFGSHGAPRAPKRRRLGTPTTQPLPAVLPVAPDHPMFNSQTTSDRDGSQTAQTCDVF